MEIILGKSSGFCFGVETAVNKAFNESLTCNNLYCLGELVHNSQVIKILTDNGIKFISQIDDAPFDAKIIFRAHGVEKDTYIKARNKNLDIIDLTCPKVKDIHNRIIQKKDDSFILLIGKKNHPEVIGSISYKKEGTVIENFDDINSAYQIFLNSQMKKIYVLSQTTFSSLKFDELIKKIREVFQNFDIKIDKTICNTTLKRQEETNYLSKMVSKMLIIGSKNSSNTKELFLVAKNNLEDTYLIETIDDLENITFQSKDILGVIASASTPKTSINEVINYLENICTKKRIK